LQVPAAGMLRPGFWGLQRLWVSCYPFGLGLFPGPNSIWSRMTALTHENLKSVRMGGYQKREIFFIAKNN